MRVLTTALCVLLLAGCALAGTPDPVDVPPRPDNTTVCVQNDREFYVRLEIIDARNGAEYGEIAVPGFNDACKEIPGATAGELVHAKIKAVGVRQDVIPPAFRHMLVGKQPMLLTIGMDGVTRFVHSSRSQ